MSYQDRKDIDELIDVVNQLKYITNYQSGDKLASKDEVTQAKINLLTEYQSSLSTLDKDLSNLDGDLSDLEDSLIAFNQSLLTFNGDTTTLATDLTKLSDNLDTFLTDISGLQESLEDFDLQLNGDANTSGFVDYLDQLESYMYGKGETYVDPNDNQTKPCSYSHPSSTSLKGMLSSLGNELQNLSSGDTELAITLSTLKTKLSSFSGTLNQFKTQIQNDVGSSVYESLNQDLIALVYEIASTNDTIDTHQGQIQAVENLIGSDEDSASSQGNSPTLFGLINDTSDVADATSQSATNLTKTLYAGSSGTGTTGQPASGSVMKNLNTVKDVSVPAVQNILYGNGTASQPADGSVLKEIDVVQTGIGNLDNLSGTVVGNINNVKGDITDVKDDIGNTQQLTGTIVTNIKNNISSINNTNEEVSTLDGALTQLLVPDVTLIYIGEYNNESLTELSNIQSKYGYSINYFWNTETLRLYKKTNNSWSQSSEPSSEMMGFTSGFNGGYANGNEPSWNYIYDYDDKTYWGKYYDPSITSLGYYGEWVKLNTVPDFFEQTPLYESVELYFSKLNHTHSDYLTQSNASSTYLTQSNASSTYLTQSNASNTYLTKSSASSTYATQTALNNKQNTIPSLTQRTSQTMYGLSVKTYSDGLNVYLTIDSSLNGNSNINKNGSTKLGQISDSTYAPPHNVQSTVRGYLGSVPPRIRVYPNGDVYLLNPSENRDYEIVCSFYYPLKSRMPSSS